jgi:hypothetical protein
MQLVSPLSGRADVLGQHSVIVSVCDTADSGGLVCEQHRRLLLWQHMLLLQISGAAVWLGC